MKGFWIEYKLSGAGCGKIHLDMKDNATEEDAILAVKALRPKATVVTVNGRPYKEKVPA